MHSGYRLKTGRQYAIAPAIDAGQETNRRIVSVGVVTGRRAPQPRAKAGEQSTFPCMPARPRIVAFGALPAEADRRRRRDARAARSRPIRRQTRPRCTTCFQKALRPSRRRERVTDSKRRLGTSQGRPARRCSGPARSTVTSRSPGTEAHAGEARRTRVPGGRNPLRADNFSRWIFIIARG